MRKIVHNFRAPKTAARGRVALVAAGLCASMALGTGAAFAADVEADVFMTAAAGNLAKVVKAQSDTQSAAADAAADGAEKTAASDRAEKTAVAEKAVAAERAEKVAADRSARTNGWVKPVDVSYHLSAGFNQSGGMWAAKHSGQDFAVASGTEVRSVHGGTVVESGWGGAYGNNIVIEHDGNTYSQYAHLSKSEVSVGDKVSAGEEIARSGNTGNSSGPHLHFEIRTTPYYGSGVDPVGFLASHGLDI